MHFKKKLLTFLLTTLSSLASSQSLVDCINDNKDGNAIWPQFYFKGDDTICFDVTSQPNFDGQNCVKHKSSAIWTSVILLGIEGQNYGRDVFFFQVDKPIITESGAQYLIRFSRDLKNWVRMEDVKVNRMTGHAVRYFATEHGGETFKCHPGKRKF